MQDHHSSNHRSVSKKQPFVYLALVLLGAGGMVVGDRLLNNQALSSPTNDAPVVSQLPTQNPLNGVLGRNDSNFIANAAEQVGPSVVRINASRTVSQQVPPAFNDPFFREFFGDRIPNGAQPRVERGVGSGFIFDDEGLILTNAHVIDGADRVTVTLRDGRTFDGEVLGEDPVTDLAVVDIDANDLPVVTLGDSERLKPGEWAIAIGNPLGLDNTVTAGIISATGRSSAQVGIPDQRASFIQTDAAINPGNSGGPLLNEKGEVIGINTAIRANAQGLGFAIPINTAERIAEQLITTGEAQHPFLGIQMATLNPEVRDNLNNNPNVPFEVRDEEGVLIIEVVPNSPAASAGLQAGDVVLSLGGESVTRSEAVQQIVENTPIGSDLSVEVRRNGETLTITVQPGPMPSRS
ncbi:MAG: HhoA/HhoB/HtrA family serine endopeptidase [Cyanobacteria bacterium J06638_22]